MRLTLVFLGFVLLQACSSHPSDQDMIAEYRVKKDSFDALADMAEADAEFSRISYDFVHPDWSLPEEERPTTLPDDRWSDYRRRFADLELETGLTIYQDAIVLERSSSGLATAGSSKGFLRSENLPTGVVLLEGHASLDCDVVTEGSCAVAKKLDRNWFLLLERH